MEITINTIILLALSMYSFFLLNELLKKTQSSFYKIYIIFFTCIHFGVTFGFAYYLNDLPTINDPHDFYNGAVAANNWFGLFGIGHKFMSFIIYPLVKLNVSIEVLFFICATISYKGFLIYFELLKVYEFIEKQKVFLLLFFLIPSIHFWTGFLGKDPLLFFLMALILKKVATQNFDYKLILLLLPVFLIRPHVCFILILSFLIFFLMDKNTSAVLKRNLIIASVIIFLCLLPIFFLFFLKMENLSMTAFLNYYNDFVTYTLNKGNTPINIIDTNVFLRVFYLVLMPLPFLYPLKNEFIFLVAIENIYYLIVFILAIIYYLKNSNQIINMKQDCKWALIASVLLILLFASYLFNIGLGNRMRIMFFPYLFYFLNRTIDMQFNIKLNGFK